MEEFEQQQEKELPRFLTCLAGLLLCPITLISTIGSLVIVFDPQVDNLPLALGLGSVFLFGSIYAFALSIRMILGAKQKPGGLLPPLALRVVGGLFYLFLLRL